MKTRDPGAPQSDAPLRQKRSNGACRHSGISGAEMDTHAEGGARRTPNPVPQIAQKLSFGGSWDTVDRSGRRVPGSHLSWWRTDCVAEDAVSCEPVSAPNSLLYLDSTKTREAV